MRCAGKSLVCLFLRDWSDILTVIFSLFTLPLSITLIVIIAIVVPHHIMVFTSIELAGRQRELFRSPRSVNFAPTPWNRASRMRALRSA
jgi:hypothetical protein